MADSPLPNEVMGTVNGKFTRQIGGGTVTPRQGWVEIYQRVNIEGERITVDYDGVGFSITASHIRFDLDAGSMGTQQMLASAAPGMNPSYLQYVCETHFTDHGGDFIIYFDVPLGGLVNLGKIISDLPRNGHPSVPIISVPTWPFDIERTVGVNNLIFVQDVGWMLRVTNPSGTGQIEGAPS